MKKLLLVLLSLAFSLPAFAADLTISYRYKGSGNGEKTVYWSDQAHFTSDKGTKVDQLIDFEKSMMYTIDHSQKLIQFMKMDDLSNMMGSMGGMMDQMMGMKMPGGEGTLGEHAQKGANQALGNPDAAKLEKLGPLQIAGRSCENYRVERKGKQMTMVEEVCIDTVLKPPASNNPRAQKMGEAAKQMTGGSLSGLSAPAQKELHALQGVALKSRMKSGGGASEEEAILVKEGPINRSVFKLPEGYKMVDQMLEIQQQMQTAQQQMQKMQGQLGNK